MTTVAFCEVDPWCRQVLAKHWPDVPCHDDVRTLNAETLANAEQSRSQRSAGSGLRGTGRASVQPANGGENGHESGKAAPDFAIDLICGGYPCQPFSQAGQRRGAEDDRHLWPEMHRLVATIRPRWVIAENVAGHISMGLDSVLSDLEGEGYTCWPIVIPACAVDAPHRRDRVWIVAHADDTERRALNTAGQRDQGRDVANGIQGRQQVSGRSEPSGEEGAVANANVIGSQLEAEDGKLGWKRPSFDGSSPARWQPEPSVGRVAHGIPKRVDRLKGLGNAVVPQIPEMIGRAIMAGHFNPWSSARKRCL
jgi:DNA (cytosine-5)-methyltransferase 1